MKRYFIYFLVAFLGGFLVPDGIVSPDLCSAGNTEQVIVSKQALDSIVSKMPIMAPIKELPADTTASDIAQWLLRALGGFLSSLIWFFLHKWFPKVFPLASVKETARRS